MAPPVPGMHSGFLRELPGVHLAVNKEPRIHAN
jgi:hypothetical protein